MDMKHGSGISAWTDMLATENEVIQCLMDSPLLYGSYRNLNPEWRQRFLDFCQGKKSLPLTYDPFLRGSFTLTSMGIVCPGWCHACLG